MRKLDRELPFFFRPGWLTSSVGISEDEAGILTGRGPYMTNSADGRAGADECLSCEKLLPVTTNAGVVIGKISNVRKISLRGPRRWNFVTGIAGEAFVLIR
jgi:hypothetical protein